MGFTSPQQMRLELGSAINDPVFLDRMIQEYFKDHKPEELPKQAPVSGYVPMSYKEPAKSAIQREDETHEEMMEKGSAALNEAIEAYLRGQTPRTPSKLIWRKHSGDEARAAHGMGAFEGAPFEYTPPRFASPSPCFRCGAARGCGCGA